MDHSYPPSLTIQLDAYSKKQIKVIQGISSGAGVVAFLSSGVDIMALISKKPTKTIKRIYKNDWNDFIARISGMNDASKKSIIRVALNASSHYRSLPGDNNWKLFRFWDGVAYAFDK